MPIKSHHICRSAHPSPRAALRNTPPSSAAHPCRPTTTASDHGQRVYLSLSNHPITIQWRQLLPLFARKHTGPTTSPRAHSSIAQITNAFAAIIGQGGTIFQSLDHDGAARLPRKRELMKPLHTHARIMQTALRATSAEQEKEKKRESEKCGANGSLNLGLVRSRGNHSLSSLASFQF